MRRHTTGPWCIGDSDLPVSQMAILQSKPTTKHNTIARMAKGIHGFEEISANARLMAAAPDLLEALQDLHAEMLAVLRSINAEMIHYDGDEFHERLGKATDAICKAIGEAA